jgi:hypothetical protein
VRKEGGNGSNRLHLKRQRCERGWGLGCHAASGEDGGVGDTERSVGERAPSSDQDPSVVATGSARCEQGTRALGGGGTVGRLVVGQPGGRRKWARPN